MKLKINFIESPTNKVRAFGLTLLTLNITTLLAVAYFWVSTNDIEINNANLLTRSSELKQRVLSLVETSKNLPDKKMLVELRNDIGRINSILVKHEFDANSALEAIEKNAPKHVFLQQLKHDSETGKITFRAISLKNNKLTILMKKLEQENTFNQVSLVRKDNIKEAGRLYHRIEIELEQNNLKREKG